MDALREFKTMGEVAVYFGVSRMTIWRWTHRPSYLALKRSCDLAVHARVATQAESDVNLATERLRQIIATGEDHAAINAVAQLLRLHGSRIDASQAAPAETVEDDQADAVAQALETVKRRRPELHAN